MPWTGPYVFTRDNGAFTGPAVWTDDRDAGTKITSAHHDTHDQDIAGGFSLVLRNDGGNSPTANISWGSFRITSLAPGVAGTDGANVNQTVTAASLDSGTNVLTLTRGAGDVTVDLTPLVVGGSTADFARLSADNTFQGINTFDQAPQSAAGFSIPRTVGNVSLWRVAADNAATFRILFSGTYTGTALAFFVTGNNAGTASIFGQQLVVASDIAGFLAASSNANITGSWNFTGGSIQLPASTTFGATGGAWQTNITASVFQLFAVSSSALLKVDYDATELTRIYAGAARVWTNNNLRVLTAAPTGGVANDLAVVVSGADRGLWYNAASVWTKLIAFP